MFIYAWCSAYFLARRSNGGLLWGFRREGDAQKRDTNKKKKSKYTRIRVTASILSQRGFTITNRL